MSKNVWVQPQTVVQQFVANEYVAACTPGHEVYKFVCDAGGGADGDVYLDSNNNRRYDPFVDEELTDWILKTYHACNKSHYAESKKEFRPGFYRELGTLQFQPVMVWTEGDTNIHCTVDLNVINKEPTKS